MKDQYDMTDYFSLPIDRFKKIELKRVYYTMISKKGGFVSFVTFLLFLYLKDDYVIDNPGTINAEIPGYYQARTFYQPVPGAKPSLADYRSTIYWEPNIKTDATGKATVSFYNTVPQTDMRLMVQGITDTGTPLVSTIVYGVK